MTAAITLYTPNSHLVTEIETSVVRQPASVLSEEQLRLKFEISRTVHEICSRRWTRIALQFPDHMLVHSARVCELLYRDLEAAALSARTSSSTKSVDKDLQSLDIGSISEGVKLTILADTSYGSCCVDEIAAEHIDADAVVHYGRACLSPTTRLPVLHIYTRNFIDENSACKAFRKTFPERATKVILTADIPYASHVQHIATKLHEAGYINVFAAEIVHNPSSIIPNRTLPEAVRQRSEALADWHLYHIAEPPTALLLNLSSKVQSIEIFMPEMPDEEGQVKGANTAMLLRRRYALVTSTNTVSTWGILINTLSVKNYLHMVDHVKQLISAAGRKSYLFVVGKLNAAKVANFSEIGGWVVIGCWESSLIDSREFFRPILTPFELELALTNDKSRVWTGAWRSDFQGVLDAVPTNGQGVLSHGWKDLQSSDENSLSEEDSAPPEFDLRTGKYVAQSRPMRRKRVLENTADTDTNVSPMMLTRRATRDIAAVNGVASPAAEFLAQKRTWKGLGSDFEIAYEDEAIEGSLIQEGRSGMARGYTVGDSVSK